MIVSFWNKALEMPIIWKRVADVKKEKDPIKLEEVDFYWK